MKNILVTSRAGFIGSNLIHYLLKAEPSARIVNMDVLTYVGSLEEKPKRLRSKHAVLGVYFAMSAWYNLPPRSSHQREVSLRSPT